MRLEGWGVASRGTQWFSLGFKWSHWKEWRTFRQKAVIQAIEEGDWIQGHSNENGHRLSVVEVIISKHEAWAKEGGTSRVAANVVCCHWLRWGEPEDVCPGKVGVLPGNMQIPTRHGNGNAKLSQHRDRQHGVVLAAWGLGEVSKAKVSTAKAAGIESVRGF